MGEVPDQLDLSMRESTRLLRDFSWRRILSFTRKPPCGVVEDCYYPLDAPRNAVVFEFFRKSQKRGFCPRLIKG